MATHFIGDLGVTSASVQFFVVPNSFYDNNDKPLLPSSVAGGLGNLHVLLVSQPQYTTLHAGPLKTCLP